MENSQTEFIGYKVPVKDIEKGENGFREYTFNDRSYYKVFLPKKVNFGGMEDRAGTAFHNLPEGSNASYLVPVKAVMNDRYDSNKMYISLPKKYRLRINVELDAKSNRRSSIENVYPDQIKELHCVSKYISFTISEKQQGKIYKTKDGSERTSILIPKDAGIYSGCRFTCSSRYVSEIKKHPNIRRVSLPAHAVFSVRRTVIIGEDPLTQQPVFDTKVISTLKGYELKELFTSENNKEKSIDKAADAEEHQQI